MLFKRLALSDLLRSTGTALIQQNYHALLGRIEIFQSQEIRKCFLSLLDNKKWTCTQNLLRKASVMKHEILFAVK